MAEEGVGQKIGHFLWTSKMDDTLFWWATTYKATWPLHNVVLWDHGANQNYNFSNITVPMSTNFVKMVAYLKKLLLTKLLDPLLDQLKLLYLHFCSVYDHKTWQDGDLPLGAPVVIVTRPINHIVLLDHVTNTIFHIFTSNKQMATKHGGMV